jgi:hypothetical protein
VFAGKAGAYLSERLLASSTNIRLGWKGFPRENTSLPRKSVNYDRKNFIVQNPREEKNKQHSN